VSVQPYHTQIELAPLAELRARLRPSTTGKRFDSAAFVQLCGLPALSARKRKPKPARTPDDLLTKHEAAARLRCSEKTIDAHAASGALRYVLIGRGSKRKRKMFAPADIAAFIEAQTQKDLPCPLSVTRVRGSTGSISGSQVIAFSARPKPRPGGKRKP
jgi:hypothetical protein